MEAVVSFNAYKNTSDVLKEFNITYLEDDYIKPEDFLIGDYIRSELEFSIREVVTNNSEYAVCETFIYPILREVWKQYKDDLMLWSHQTLKYDEKLSGIPDYIVSKRSPLGKVVFEQPFCIVVEAKQDNFTEGWGQCLAELVAAQKINESVEMTLFGIVSNGIRWEFGQLKLDRFIKNIKGYSLENLDDLFGAVAYVFEQCQLQLSNEVTKLKI